jgi:hypothetical protein
MGAKIVRAEQLKEEMREEMAMVHKRIAQSTAYEALSAIQRLTREPSYRYHAEQFRDDVEPLVAELQALVALLAECAPNLPAKPPAIEVESEAAQ